MSNSSPKKPKPKKSPGKPRARGRTNNAWTTPTVLGLILSAVGLLGLVVLRPQLQVSPLPQLDPRQAFSAPFRIINNGTLPATISLVTCYLHEAKYPGLTVSRQTGQQSAWNGGTLSGGGSQAIVCKMVGSPEFPTKADMAVVIDYRAFGIPHTFRQYSRFVGETDKTWEWLDKPTTDDFRKAADDEIKAAEKSLGLPPPLAQ
jgi:hypothetical protein